MTIKSEPITFSWLVNVVLGPLCGVLMWSIYQNQNAMQEDHNQIKIEVAVMKLQTEVNSKTLMQITSDIRDIRNQFTQKPTQ